MLHRMPAPGRSVDSQQDVDAVPTRLERLMRQAISQGASDLHLEPAAREVEVRQRIDGILTVTERLPAQVGRGMITRLMVLAQLLTYRHDIPQEGRLLIADDPAHPADTIALRLSIMPTTHGLRAVIRLPVDAQRLHALDELGLPGPTLDALKRFARSDSGMLLVTGPAGSGKTTTLYALLGHLSATSPGLSIIALEDPVERDLPGVTQIEVSPFGELTYAKALRSILRQDPQVLMLGEIRDAETASIAVQAALSGHRLIATMHAGTTGGAVARLMEMGIEPYQLTGALFGVITQRLVRRRSDDGSYRGRFPLAEAGMMQDAVRRAILDQADADAISRAFSESIRHQSLHQVAKDAVANGLTDEAEVRRVLGAERE